MPTFRTPICQLANWALNSADKLQIHIYLIKVVQKQLIIQLLVALEKG